MAPVALFNPRALPQTGPSPQGPFQSPLAVRRYNQHSQVVTDSAYARLILNTPGLVSYWRLDEASGTLAVDWNGLNDGTYTSSGVTLGQAGAISRDNDASALFDGTAGWVSVPASPSIQSMGALTIEAWLYPTLSAQTRILGPDLDDQGHGYGLYLNAGCLTTQLNGTAGQGQVGGGSPQQLPLNQWSYAATVWDGANISLYINGVLSMGPSAFTGALVYPPDPPTIGASARSAGRLPFAGRIDEFALYNVALAPADIYARYQLATLPVPSGTQYLPRRLGPRAVGPTFFAALQPKPRSLLVFTNALADTSLSSDTLARVVGLPRANTDTTLSSDSLARSALSFARSASETSTSSDALSPKSGFPRTAADTSASSDSLVRSALPFARTSSDISTSSAALTRLVQFSRSTADTSTSSDSIAPLTRFSRTSSDTTVSSDSLARLAQFSRSLANTSASSDTLTRSSLPFARTTSDTSTSSDSLGRLAQFARSTADTSTSSAALTYLRGVGRFLTETSLSSDAASQHAAFARALADTSTTTDRIGDRIPRSLADTSTSSDTLSGVRVFARTLTSTSVSVDSLQSRASGARALFESSTSSDVLSVFVFIRPRASLFVGSVTGSQRTGGSDAGQRSGSAGARQLAGVT